MTYREHKRDLQRTQNTEHRTHTQMAPRWGKQTEHTHNANGLENMTYREHTNTNLCVYPIWVCCKNELENIFF